MRKIVENSSLIDFGWMLDSSQIYYVIRETEDELDWYSYDLNSQVAKAIVNPFVPDDLLNSLSDHRTHSVVSVSVSPSGNRALYTVRPDHKPPSTATPSDRIEAADLWFSMNRGRQRKMLVENFSFSCGNLAFKSIWRKAETLVLGTCNPYYGLPVQFVAYPEMPSFRLLKFQSKLTGPAVSVFQADISHDGQWITFVDQNNSLWLLRVDQLDTLMRDGLDDAFRISLDGAVYGPQWSSDGSIYFWLLSQGNHSEESLTLAHFNPGNGKVEIVLADKQLDDLSGIDFEEQFINYRLPGYETGWSLSADGNRGLIAMGDNFTIESLWMLTWQRGN